MEETQQERKRRQDREAHARWRKAHPEYKIKIKKYRQENREKVKAWKRQWYAKNKEKVKAQVRANTTKRIGTYKRSAAERGHNWALPDDTAKQLFLGACFYCGIIPAHGIDRKDSTVGYEVANCVSCCKTHNMMKGVLTVDTFLGECRKIIAHVDG